MLLVVLFANLANGFPAEHGAGAKVLRAPDALATDSQPAHKEESLGAMAPLSVDPVNLLGQFLLEDVFW